jgi:hypothetical protein
MAVLVTSRTLINKHTSMKNKSWLLATVAVAASLNLNAADVTGKITLKGTPPPEKPYVDIKGNKDCGPLVKGDLPTTKFFVVGPGGALADVIVSLKGENLKGKSTGDKAEPILIDQVACLYTPQISAAQTKQKIKVRNSDPVMHNVHPAPVAAGNKEANKAQMPKSPDLEFAFDNTESFLKFRCDVHPWMLAWVTVFDHPYFAVSAKDGSYTIKNVPAGKYTLEATHRKGGTVTKEIEVKDQNVATDLVVELK